MVKVSRYSNKSEEAVHRYTLKNAVLKSFKQFIEENLCMSPFLNKVVGIQSTFLAKHVQATASAKYLLFVTSTSVTKCDP